MSKFIPYSEYFKRFKFEQNIKYNEKGNFQFYNFVFLRYPQFFVFKYVKLLMFD